jgi:hypothetical protein
LNEATTFWQSGGIKALETGCSPAAAGRPIWVVAGIGAPGNFNAAMATETATAMATATATATATAMATAMAMVPLLFLGGREGKIRKRAKS